MITAIETAIFAEQELPAAAASGAPQRGRSMTLCHPYRRHPVSVFWRFPCCAGFWRRWAEAEKPRPNGTPAGTFVAGAETLDPERVKRGR